MNKEIIKSFLEKGFLLSPDLDLNNPLDLSFEDTSFKEVPLVLDKQLFYAIENKYLNVSLNWIEFERSKVLYEKGKVNKIYTSFLEVLHAKEPVLNNEIVEDVKIELLKENVPEQKENNVIVLKHFNEDGCKRDTQDFVSYFKSRYENLKKFLENRQGLDNVTSIARILSKTEKEEVSLIGLVYDKKVTKNGNVMLVLEDTTGLIHVLVNKNRKELMNIVNDVVLDEVIGVKGLLGDKIIFSNSIVLPDIFLDNKLKKSEDEVYAAFIGDLHIGSRMFLLKEFLRFINWLNMEEGEDIQKEIAKKVKYLFILGDVVDGIGIYPEQDRELIIQDIYEQYSACARLLKKIRKDIKIIICPGDHDASRISEPQPFLNKEFTKDLYEMENVIMVNNPGTVNIHASENFDGFNILLYHGRSFIYYISNIDSIRNKGGFNGVDLTMSLLLQKRHLAPSHGSSLYIPYKNEDPLIINKTPDIFVSAHLHKTNVGSYHNILTISCSCWQSKTSLQEKIGHNPDPCKVPIVNLKTREIKILRFDQ